jgi:hypothetical protein
MMVGRGESRLGEEERRGAILDEAGFEGYNAQVPVLEANDARALRDPGMEKSPDKVYGQYRRLQ